MMTTALRVLVNRIRLYTHRTRLIESWIVPVDQPVVWIAQLPRSGGTMLSRLFDGHPETHVIPKPSSFGGNKSIAWPDNETISPVGIRRKLDMSAVSGSEFRKKSSNVEQVSVPIYFDGLWYRRICAVWKPNVPAASRVRNQLATIFTAFFNAWRNYQNLYGEKRYVVVQSIIDPSIDFKKTYDNFRAAYPDGYWIFSFRPPEDWLTSIAKLSNTRAEYGGTSEEMAAYATAYENAAQLIGEPGFIGIDFRDFVAKGESSIKSLACDRLGLYPDSALFKTTTNRLPAFQNSSHNVEKQSVVDPTRAHAGKKMLDQLKMFEEFDNCVDAYSKCIALLRNHELIGSRQ